MKHTTEEMFDYLVLVVGSSYSGLNMLIGINGDTKETYNDALYFLTGERDIDASIDEYNAEMED